MEWLDEYHPGSFRQAQVSFSTRIPNAFPLGDSLSMSTTVSLYSTANNLRHVVREVAKDASGNILPCVKEEDAISQAANSIHGENQDNSGGSDEFQVIQYNIFLLVY